MDSALSKRLKETKSRIVSENLIQTVVEQPLDLVLDLQSLQKEHYLEPEPFLRQVQVLHLDLKMTTAALRDLPFQK